MSIELSYSTLHAFSREARDKISEHSGVSDKQYVVRAYETTNSIVIDEIKKTGYEITSSSILILICNLEDNEENITTCIFAYSKTGKGYSFIGKVESDILMNF